MKRMMRNVVIIGMIIVYGAVPALACGGASVPCGGTEGGDIDVEQCVDNCGATSFIVAGEESDTGNEDIGDISITNETEVVWTLESLKGTQAEVEIVTTEAEDGPGLFLVGQPINGNTIKLDGIDWGTIEINQMPINEKGGDVSQIGSIQSYIESMCPHMRVNTVQFDEEQVRNVEISQEAVTENALFFVGQDVMVNSVEIQGGNVKVNNFEWLEDEGNETTSHVEIETETGTILIHQQSTVRPQNFKIK